VSSARRLKVAEEFAQWTRRQLGNKLVRVVLFGSVARGEEKDGSDIDLLIEVRGDPVAARRQLGGRILEIAAEEGVFVSAFVRPAPSPEASARSGIYRTIEKEGRVLA